MADEYRILFPDREKQYNPVNESSKTSKISANRRSPIGFFPHIFRCIRNRYGVTLSPRVHSGLTIRYRRTNSCSWASASPFLFAKDQ